VRHEFINFARSRSEGRFVNNASGNNTNNIVPCNNNYL